MKQLFLMTVLCLFAGLSGATFELDDPTDPVEDVNDNMKKLGRSASKMTAKEKFIVPAGINLYIPNIVKGNCIGWHFDESEINPDDSNNMQFITNTTYIGATIRTIECKNEVEGTSLNLALIQTEGRRLIWVESDKILPAD